MNTRDVYKKEFYKRQVQLVHTAEITFGGIVKMLQLFHKSMQETVAVMREMEEYLRVNPDDKQKD